MMNRIKTLFSVLVILALLLGGGLPFGGQPAAADDTKQPLSPYETILTDGSGRQITEVIFPLPPPKIKVGVAATPKAFIAGATNSVSNVPAFDWSYGCSATAAAMLFGYYDRTGYSQMYTGPTGGGVSPLDNSSWGHTTYYPSGVICGECPLSATHNGIDGRAIKGHVDDYWIDAGNAGPDPYVGNWVEHTLGDCTGDYMGTNQSKFSNTDGGTRFYWYTTGDPLYDFTAYEPTYRDGCHGMKLFAESRGYTVLTNFTQVIYGYQGTDPGKGFTFANFQSEIDAGRPVLIHVYNPAVGGHTMLGYGYDTAGSVIYVHDTWDYSNHNMTWGGTYSTLNLQHRAVSVIRLQAIPPAVTNSNGATNIMETTARLNGQITSTGGENPTVHVYWGPTDGGTTSGNWVNNINLGAKAAGTFYTDISSLTAGTPYYYRCYAFNSAGGSWAASTANFTTKELVSIAITPPNPTIAKGRSQPFSATGNYTSGPTANITTSANWTSSNTAIATVGPSTGLAVSLAVGSTNITAVSGNISAITLLTVGPQELDTLAITPDNPTVAKGRAQQFTATGTYSDSSTANITATVTWSSSDIDKAIVSSDVSDFVVASDNTTIYVVDKENHKIYKSTTAGSSWTELAKPAGMDEPQLIAVFPDDANRIAVIADGTEVYISLPSGEGFASTGNVTNQAGTANATALYGIAVSPSVSGIRYIAVAGKSAASGAPRLYYLNYGAPVPAWRDAVGDAPWTPPAAGRDAFDAVAFSPNFASDYIAVALSSKAAGGADALALHILSFNSFIWDSVVASGYPVIVDTTSGAMAINKASLALGPDYMGGDEALRRVFVGYAGTDASVETGGIFRMVDTTKKELTSAPAAINSVSFNGTNLVAGSYNTNLVYRSTNPLDTTPTLLSSTIGPSGVNKVKVAFSGDNVFAGTSGTGSFFAVSSNYGETFTPLSLMEFGLAQTLAEGHTTISAVSGNATDTTLLTISAKVLDSLAVTSDNLTIAAGRSQQFTATGTYSDSSTGNITTSVTWSSSNTTVAWVNGAGLVTSYEAGTANITATKGAVSGNLTLNVGPPVIDYIYVTPVNPSITYYPEALTTVPFMATLYYTAGIPSLLLSANWTSSSNTTANINSSGLATLGGAGTTVISVESSGYTANTTLTVLPDTVAPSVRITSPCDGQILSNNTTIITGTVSDYLASANVTINGGAPIPLTPSSGNFSQSVSLNNGSNTILVSAFDSTGNIGTSGTITVTVNQTRPGIIIAQPLAGTVVNNPSMTVNGTISGNVTTANLILNGVSQSVSVVSGNFSVNVTLVEGTNILVVNAYTGGHAGDSNYLGTSGARTVKLDTTPPVVTIEYPMPGMTFSSAIWPSVQGTVNDPGVSTVNITFNSYPTYAQVIGGRFSLGVIGLSLVSGNNTATVTATDEAGNSGSANVTIVYDSTHAKPEVRITSPANNLYTNIASQNVTGTVSDASITSAYLARTDANITVITPITVTPNGAYGLFNANLTLAAGTNIIEVRASDNATPAHTGTSGNVTVTLDNTAPVITIGMTDPTNSITITVSSNEALTAAPLVSVNTTSVTMTPSGIDQWRGTYGTITSPIANGVYRVSANATDKAGNATIRTATFCKETVTITENGTATVSNNTTTLQISTTANVTNASVSVVQHFDNPSGSLTPSGADKVAGVFLEIVVSPELRDNLRQIYIQVDYDRDLLLTNTDESSLKLYLWDVASGTWQAVAGSSVNTTGQYIYGTITHVSQYGGFGTVPEVTPPTPPSPPSGGDGGGGGGGGGPVGEKMITSLTNITSATFKILEDVEAPSVDTLVKIFIKKGTTLVNKQGNMVSSITVEKLAVIPPAGDNNQILGGVYDFRPVGAHFNPPATLIIEYKENAIPEGVSKNSLYIAVWNEDKQQWERTDCTNDTDNNKISTLLDHFSTYTIMISKRPAEFKLGDLTVNPASFKLGGNVTISVLVTNTGDLTGNYTVTLKIDNTVVGTKDISLDGAKNITTSFTVTPKSAGEHTVEIGNLSGRFKVEEAPPPPVATPVPAQAPRPASFTVSDLTITPGEVRPAEPLTISALVTNSGGSDGAYTAVLKINDVEEARKAVSLGAGKSERVTFTIARDTGGSFTIEIGGKTGMFTVIIPALQTSKPIAKLPVQPTVNRTPVIFGIIGGIVVIAALVYLFIWRRRA